MIIMLILWVIALIALGHFFRAQVARVASGIFFNAAAIWEDFRNDAWPVIGSTVIVAIVVGGLGWLILMAILLTMGAFAHSLLSAFIISILFPFWFVAFIAPAFLKRVWVLGPVIRIVRSVCGPVLLLAVLPFAFGIFNPEAKDSYDGWMKKKGHALANTFSVWTLNTKGNIYGTVSCDTAMYYTDGSIKLPLVVKGAPIMNVEVDDQPSSDQSKAEKMVVVMLRNTAGNFVGGTVGLVPERNITWE